ncbi:hypothetical protein [Streptococcus sobrinus]|uniref:hypothetical protein n=1 Tax=Streptococcus sobrinus TaxID=1310 RepID=UPI0003054B63|nr:hypothetical protein [Streptococcus sobrinus]OZV23083.1 hypothetical protein RO09_00960 [Streptococcus sobrinus]
MFSFLILIWLILLLVWLFGKTRPTFRDWFPFLFFIYLFLLLLMNQENLFGNFNFIQWLLFILFVISIISDFLNGIRYLLQRTKITKTLLKYYDKVKRYLFWEKISEFSSFLIVVIILLLVWIQKSTMVNILGNKFKYSIPIINLVKKSNLEIFGFVVAILSIYGIYLGFLQYLTSDIKEDIYLGQSKMQFLTKDSFWYHVTQSKLFFLLLLATIIIPIFVKMNLFYVKDLEILWQTIYLLLLIIYIFLLDLNLYIIRVVLLVKNNDDNVFKANIRRSWQQKYTEIFWQGYNRKENLRIYHLLQADLKKVNDNERLSFIQNIFEEDHFNNSKLFSTIWMKVTSNYRIKNTQKLKNLIETILFTDRIWLKTYKERIADDISKEWYNFYNYYKSFVLKKWEFLFQINDSTVKSYEALNPLLKNDEEIFEKILQKSLYDDRIINLEMDERHRGVIDKVTYEISRNSILKKLFDYKCELINEVKNLNNLEKEMEKSTRKINADSIENFTELQKQFLKKLEEYRWKKILQVKTKFNSKTNLPSSDIIITSYDDSSIDDYDNSNLYSRVFLERIISQFDESLYQSMNSIYKILYHLYNTSNVDSNWEIDWLIEKLNAPVEVVASEVIKRVFEDKRKFGIDILKNYDNKFQNKLWKHYTLYKKKEDLDNLILMGEKRYTILHGGGSFQQIPVNRRETFKQRKKRLKLKVVENQLLCDFVLLNDLNKDSSKYFHWIKKVNEDIISILNKHNNIECEKIVNGTLKLFDTSELVTADELRNLFIDIEIQDEMF